MRPLLHSLARRAAMLVLVMALVVGLVPRSGGYRCLAMGIIASAPCCDKAGSDGEQPQTPRLIAAACCEHVPVAVSTAPAVREPVRSLAAPQCLSGVAPFLVGSLPGSAGWRLDTAFRRAGPDQRHRVTTVVLRV